MLIPQNTNCIPDGSQALSTYFQRIQILSTAPLLYSGRNKSNPHNLHRSPKHPCWCFFYPNLPLSRRKLDSRSSSRENPQEATGKLWQKVAEKGVLGRRPWRKM